MQNPNKQTECPYMIILCDNKIFESKGVRSNSNNVTCVRLCKNLRRICKTDGHGLSNQLHSNSICQYVCVFVAPSSQPANSQGPNSASTIKAKTKFK